MARLARRVVRTLMRMQSLGELLCLIVIKCPTPAKDAPLDLNGSIAMGAVTAATNKHAVMIITLTSSGNSARLIAKYQPRCPIAVVTRSAQVGAACNLHHGGDGRRRAAAVGAA